MIDKARHGSGEAGPVQRDEAGRAATRLGTARQTRRDLGNTRLGSAGQGSLGVARQAGQGDGEKGAPRLDWTGRSRAWLGRRGESLTW
jgi:hypothetical protein